ncbi:8242_t:CDS:1, partial [Funneliformis caledonium]
ETGDSFLYSFASKRSRNGKLARVTETEKIYAVSYSTNNGPCFGGGWDLAIKNDHIRNYTSSYSGNKFLSSNNRHLEDYEVFQVIKN